MLTEDYVRQAKITRWVDGDTVDVLIDLGFNISLAERVRVLGLNCREVTGAEKQFGLLDKAHAEELIPVGTTVVFQSHKSKDKDKYGRWLAAILMNDGTVFADRMIRDGHGRVATY